MPFTPEQVADIFTYHAPIGDQPAKYDAIRSAARVFAWVMIENTPSSLDQSAAMRLLRECVMTANSAIANGGKY